MILFTQLILSLFMIASNTIHDYSIEALDSDKEINLAEFKGKKILIVNVASKCGYTPQYEPLEELYRQYKDKLVVIGFPCNQFLSQEPGSELEIKQFCQKNYGVSFPMTTKIDVKGKDQHPIYSWLTKKEFNGVDDFKVSWNFNKFLIDENGKLIDHFGSGVDPFDEEIVKHLK